MGEKIKQIGLFLAALTALAGLLWQFDRHVDAKVDSESKIIMAEIEADRRTGDIRYYEQRRDSLYREEQRLRKETNRYPGDTWLQKDYEDTVRDLDEAEREYRKALEKK